jgi:hypothetical protein
MLRNRSQRRSGVAGNDEGGVKMLDQERVLYIGSHLEQKYRVIPDGTDSGSRAAIIAVESADRGTGVALKRRSRDGDQARRNIVARR